MSITASPTAFTTYGTCGVKVWIFKGEIMEHDPMAQDKKLAEADAGRPRRDGAVSQGIRASAMLQPARTKFRKALKGRIHGTATSGANLDFGQFGLKALEPERVTARQIEAARRALTRHMKRAGRVWIRVFPDVPVSKKPIEVRMGKGKGTPEFWVVPRQARPHPVRDRRRPGR